MKYQIEIDKNTGIIISYNQTNYPTTSKNSYFGFFVDVEVDNTDKLINSYYKNDNIYKLPLKTNRFFIFSLEDESWVFSEYLFNNFKLEKKQSINEYAYHNIDTTYPIYRQLNIEADYGKDSTEYQTMRTFINAVRDLSNQYTLEIQNAETEEAINTSFDNYKTELDKLCQKL
jgi:hypothetical protein